jgi:outer membrane protein insertion porin family/translocation and assembly module TamA
VFWKLFASLSYNIQIEDPFSYKGPLDETLETLLISFPELVTNFDFSDSRVSPHRGFFVGNSFQVAGGIFGGDARDVRILPDGRVYVPLARRATLALRGALGFVFPSNYGESLAEDLAAPPSVSDPERSRDLQLVFFRGLFAGGPNSNRGYPLRGIGPHGFLPSQIPAGAAAVNSCDPEDPEFAGEDCRVPVGGLTRWEASAEARMSVSGAFSAALFCDAADVSAEVADVRLAHLHLSCGPGARYETPVGPIRLDIGYRIPGLQVLGPEDPNEFTPSLLFGVFPIAVSVGIGEAF